MCCAQSAPSTPAAPAHTNRLATESSPYLRQHAHNPVDWMPWGDEAFAEARRRNVPIFLSIGYSTCYWCHVMERESFEDEAIAKLLNENFVCIKVDREERPDVDDVYMMAVQLMSGRGGWPMSVWLTPPGTRAEQDAGLEPFYAGTYFPPEPRSGMASLPEVAANIARAWKQDHDKVMAQAAQVTQAIREEMTRGHEPVRVGPNDVARALQTLLNIHDTKYGGFGQAPKFPQPVFCDFLLELAGRIREPAIDGAVRSAVRVTLDKMALGGMYDQVGGGFHRYSTDEKWLVPHFEKMLYDNAQLASLYARSFAISRDPFDARVVRETLDYVLREMLDKETGAFWSAQDAEVDGREGQNYLWTRAQLTEALGESESVFAARLLGFEDGPNFQDPHHPEDGRKNVLFLPDRPEKLAQDMKLDGEEFGKRWGGVQTALLKARGARPQPRTDDKVITSWNGLMIGALADGSMALGAPAYLDAGERAAKFFLVNMRTKTGGLFRTYRDTKAKTAGFLEDYAFVVQGLIKLHLASAAFVRADLRYLNGAEELTRIALERFGSPEAPGALFDTRDGQPDLLVRARSVHDGALPSGQGVMLHNLIDLYQLTRKPEYLERAIALAGSLSSDIARNPVGSLNATRAVLRLLAVKPDALDSLPAPATAAAEPTNPSPTVSTEPPVEVHASSDRIGVPKSGSAELHLKLVIKPGMHIAAHEPGVEGMQGLSIRVEGGEGIEAQVQYPEGEPYKGAASPPGKNDKPLLVHHGELELTVRLSRTEALWSARPMLVLTYVACTDRECLAPQTVSLDVAIDPG